MRESERGGNPAQISSCVKRVPLKCRMRGGRGREGEREGELSSDLLLCKTSPLEAGGGRIIGAEAGDV